MTLLSRFFAGESGCTNLSETITINGVSVASSIALEGVNASASGWTSEQGDAFVLVSSGTDPTYLVKGPYTDSTRVLRLNAGKVFEAPNTTVGQVATEDFVVEIAGFVGSNTSALVTTKTNSAAAQGWRVTATSTAWALQFADSGGATSTVSVTLTAGTWNHVMWFVDRNGTIRSYINGTASSTAATSASATITSANKLTVGSYPSSDSYSNPTNHYFTRIAMWKQASWCTAGGTEEANIARARCAALGGLYPQTYAGSGDPTQMTRTSPAYIDLIDQSTDVRTLFRVGGNYGRLCTRKERTGGQYIAGYLSEVSRTNLFLRSQEFATTWSATAATISSDAIAAPDGTTTADGIIGSAANTSHLLSQSVTLAATKQVYSVWGKKGASDYLGLYVATLGNGIMFNLNTGAMGNRFAATANVTGGIENWGNGWFRVYVVYTGTVASYAHRLYPSRADWSADSTASEPFLGDAATVDTYVWGAQVEAVGASGHGIPTSYVPTTNASAARSADDLRFAALSNYGDRGLVIVNVLDEDPDTATSNDIYVVDASVSTSNRVSVYLTGGQLARGTSRVGNVAQALVTGSPDAAINDGEIRTLRFDYDTNLFKIAIDGTFGSSDTSGSVPPVAATGDLFPGSSRGAAQPNILISDLQFHDYTSSLTGTIPFTVTSTGTLTTRTVRATLVGALPFSFGLSGAVLARAGNQSLSGRLDFTLALVGELTGRPRQTPRRIILPERMTTAVLDGRTLTVVLPTKTTSVVPE